MDGSGFRGGRLLLVEGMRRLAVVEEAWKLRIGFEFQDFLLNAFQHHAPSRLNVSGSLPTPPLLFREPALDDVGAENHGPQAEGTRWGRNEHPVVVEFVDLVPFPGQGQIGDWRAVRAHEETEIPGGGDEVVEDKHDDSGGLFLDGEAGEDAIAELASALKVAGLEGEA
jgi:hypothetical protein